MKKLLIVIALITANCEGSTGKADGRPGTEVTLANVWIDVPSEYTNISDSTGTRFSRKLIPEALFILTVSETKIGNTSPGLDAAGRKAFADEILTEQVSELETRLNGLRQLGPSGKSPTLPAMPENTTGTCRRFESGANLVQGGIETHTTLCIIIPDGKQTSVSPIWRIQASLVAGGIGTVSEKSINEFKADVLHIMNSMRLRP